MIPLDKSQGGEQSPMIRSFIKLLICSSCETKLICFLFGFPYKRCPTIDRRVARNLSAVSLPQFKMEEGHLKFLNNFHKVDSKEINGRAPSPQNTT